MARNPIDFHPDTAEMTVCKGRLALSDVVRLWSVVAIAPDTPDERHQRWVIEAAEGIVMAPALNLPTTAHVDALAAWGQQQQRLYRMELLGWPWTLQTWRWAWCAMSQGTEEFDLATWQAVQSHALPAQGPEGQGPCALHTLLQAA